MRLTPALPLSPLEVSKMQGTITTRVEVTRQATAGSSVRLKARHGA